MGFISGYASNTIRIDEKTTMNQEIDKDIICIVDHPPMYYTIYNSLTLTFFVAPYHVVFLENFTTGESLYCFVGSSFISNFHITEETGLWRISVATDPRHRNPEIIYERYFIIDNGEIIDYEPGLQEIIGF